MFRLYTHTVLGFLPRRQATSRKKQKNASVRKFEFQFLARGLDKRTPRLLHEPAKPQAQKQASPRQVRERQIVNTNGSKAARQYSSTAPVVPADEAKEEVAVPSQEHNEKDLLSLERDP